jgi:hypothetical protein
VELFFPPRSRWNHEVTAFLELLPLSPGASGAGAPERAAKLGLRSRSLPSRSLVPASLQKQLCTKALAGPKQCPTSAPTPRSPRPQFRSYSCSPDLLNSSTREEDKALWRELTRA